MRYVSHCRVNGIYGGDEYSGSEDTARLKGTLAKAKANAAQGVPELCVSCRNIDTPCG